MAKEGQAGDMEVALTEIYLFIKDTFKYLLLKKMEFSDYEWFIDAVTHSISLFKHTTAMLKDGEVDGMAATKIMKVTTLIADIDNMLSKRNNSDSDSDSKEISQVDEETELINKLILYKYLVINSIVAIEQKEVRIKTQIDVVYEVQPFLNKMLNLSVIKESLMQFKVDKNNSKPSNDAWVKIFTFIKNLVELFCCHNESMPSTFNIEHYFPMWMLFLTMKASQQYKTTILSGILTCKYIAT